MGSGQVQAYNNSRTLHGVLFDRRDNQEIRKIDEKQIYV